MVIYMYVLINHWLSWLVNDNFCHILCSLNMCAWGIWTAIDNQGLCNGRAWARKLRIQVGRGLSWEESALRTEVPMSKM